MQDGLEKVMARAKVLANKLCNSLCMESMVEVRRKRKG